MSVIWYDFNSGNFDIYGISETDFTRLPQDIAKQSNDGVAENCQMSAGGRIRFKTDSKKIYISIDCETDWDFGFDLYKMENGVEIFAGAFRNTVGFIKNGEFSADVTTAGTMTAYTLNFPCFAKIKSFRLGIDEGSQLCHGEKYINEKPVLFYGSSITHGAFASRPGMTYEAMISQRFNLNYLNMGFSGSCKAETPLVKHLANLDISVFVSDYDHNAYENGYLEQTHLKMYKTVREIKPDIPYIMLTRPDYWTEPENNDKRIAIIRATYDYAVSQGDKNVWFIDGKTLFNGDYYRSCTQDGCHPNDIGFYRMAQRFAPVIAEALGLEIENHDYRNY